MGRCTQCDLLVSGHTLVKMNLTNETLVSVRAARLDCTASKGWNVMPVTSFDAARHTDDGTRRCTRVATGRNEARANDMVRGRVCQEVSNKQLV
jgi:hypothetical protein